MCMDVWRRGSWRNDAATHNGKGLMVDDETWDSDTWESTESEWDSADDSGDEATVACPYCGEEMFDDAPQCTACGNYISAEDHAPESKPTWVMATAVVCLLMALGWVLFG